MIAKSRNLFAAASVLAIAAAVAAGASPADDQSQSSPAQIKALQEEVGELRAEVRALKEQQQPTRPVVPAQEPESDVARELKEEVDRRGQFLDAAALTAGYDTDKGFFIGSDDKNFMMSPFILLQTRYVTNWRQDAKAGGSDDTQNGFEMRRLQLGFDGNAFSPDFTYRIFWQASSKNGELLELELAWFQYRFHDSPWVIGGGQFKDPFYHEQLLSDGAQLAVERTFADEILADGEAFSKGVTLRYDDGGPFRVTGAVTSGIDNNNDNFEGFPTNPSTFGLAGRAEYKVFGQWKDYAQFTSEGNDQDLLVVGAGGDWTESGHTNAYRHAVDIQYNPGALGLYASYLGEYTSGNTAGRGGDTYDSSITLQASYLFTSHFEGFGRYDYTHLDGKEFSAGMNAPVQEFTVGGSYYFFGQRAKLVGDLSYFLKGTPMGDIGDDILSNPGHGELLFRGEFQLKL